MKTPNPIDKHVGSRLRMRRLMLGMSQEKLAEAFGLEGRTVTQRKDVIPVVEEARGSRKTVVIDFQVEQEDTVYPMVPAGAALDAMIRRPSPSPIVETGADA